VRSASKVSELEIWPRVGKKIIRLSTNVFTSSHNFEVRGKLIKFSRWVSFVRRKEKST